MDRTDSNRPLTIFLSAAEASGDEHASHLAAALRHRLPQARLVGVGGPKTAAAGCEVLLDVTEQSAMVGAVLTRLPYYMRLVKRLKQMVLDVRPDVLVPTDSPALNWHLCEAAKACGGKVFHYISPQVWAWAPWRVKRLRRLSDYVACILPFEERYLRDRGVRASYVGHPLFDTLAPPPEPMPDLVEAWSQGNWQVALLPGSRPAELRHHSRALAATADAIRARWPAARCVFTARTELAAQAIREQSGRSDLEIAVGRTREVLAQSHFAVAVSGTVTLEVANYGVPMLIVYRANRTLYRLIKPMFCTPYLSLVNILGGRCIVPELMPWSGSVRHLAGLAVELMNDLGWLCETRQALLELADSLRPPPGQTASGNAAELIARLAADREKPL